MSKVIALLTIICGAAVGYRRAGFELVPGENTLEDVTKEQLEMLNSDPCITVVGEQGEKAGEESGLDPLQLVDLIQGLDKDNAELWTADNKPKASNFPKGVSAEERELAWSLFLEQLEQ